MYGWNQGQRRVEENKMKPKIISVTPVTCNFKDFLSRKSTLSKRIPWAIRYTKYILEETKKYDLECWFVDTKLKAIKEITYAGIKCKFFPCFELITYRSFSSKLIDKLRKEVKNQKTIIQLFDYHDWLSYKICREFKKVPIVAHLLGTANPLSLICRKPLLFLAFPLLIIEQLLERIVFKSVDYFFVTNNEKKYLHSFVNGRIDVTPFPIDYSKIRCIEKKRARKALGLSMKKKMLLFIGRLDRLRDTKRLINTFEDIDGRLDLQMVVIGASPKDSFYKKAKKAGVKLLPVLDHKETLIYHSAADAYITLGKKTIKYNTMGIAAQEALACNRPVISYN
ncbi:glycosyltransferase, partial [Nanoarchaeota archaeon]